MTDPKKPVQRPSCAPRFELPRHEQPGLSDRIARMDDKEFEAFMFEQLPYLRKPVDNDERSESPKRQGILTEFEVHAFAHGPRCADKIRRVSSYSDRLGVFGQIIMSGRYRRLTTFR